MEKTGKLLITGAAGLVGQNLVAELSRQGYTNIVALDNHKGNLDILRANHPDVACVHADLALGGEWEQHFTGAGRLFLLQAQIVGASFAPYQRNTLDSTQNVLSAAKKHGVPFTVFVGSSVVNSVVDYNYKRSKQEQEDIVRSSGLPYCVVRPTLMFGWFDPKLLGWLSRFMERVPVYPIPGHGRYMRQPLYVRDFCRALIWCAEHSPEGKSFDIAGEEDITYIDIIRAIKKVKKLRTVILCIPVPVFRWLLKVYALFVKNPPFVEEQLDALMGGDHFPGNATMQKTFGFTPTPFAQAIEETFTHPVYSKIILERWT
jgi:nucleoside-diphosphate-sugar epimerase